MTGFLFIRHTAHDLIPTTISGRMPGVHLNQTGRAAAEGLAEELASLPIRRILSGPLERARETAEPLSRKLGIDVQTAAEFDELATGEWTGLTFQQLGSRDDWKQWNTFRSAAHSPGGELMLEVQLRVVRKLLELRKDDGLTAIFSHGDVIRATVAYYLGVPLDLFLRIAIDPGSVTFLQIDDRSVLVRCVNASGADAARRVLG